ncbi:MAG TPA: class I SAM-dependent methyltransferase [Blastocatellia bacterium]
MAEVERSEGRRAFGHDPEGYLDARPGYTAELYAILTDHCGLRPGTATLEIGPGPGLATRHLIELGASPLTLVEPDPRLAKFLAEELGPIASGLEIYNAAFEDADLPSASYDLAVCASAFHWVEQRPGLEKAARVLRPGGWWAMWWNSFGGVSESDAFHNATRPFLGALDKSPSVGAVGPHIRRQFAVDVDGRLADLRSVSEFTDIGCEVLKRKLVYDSKKLRALYATFSPIALLEPMERERVLDGVQGVADREFGGQVEREIATPIYTARRKN